MQMTHNDYLWPGIAAITVAVLTPFYWGYIALSDYVEGVGSGLVLADWVFVLLYALMIYVYLSLKHILNDQNNFRGIDNLLAMLIGTCVIYVVGSIALELFAPLINDSFGETRNESILVLGTVLTVSCTVVWGVLDIIIGVVLLRNAQALPDLIRIFAIVNLIQGIFEVTIIFSFFAIVIFSIACLILAIHFLRKPEMIEVV